MVEVVSIMNGCLSQYNATLEKHVTVTPTTRMYWFQSERLAWSHFHVSFSNFVYYNISIAARNMFNLSVAALEIIHIFPNPFKVSNLGSNKINFGISLLKVY